MLAKRLANRMKHLRKWARRQDVSCFRVYERDIPDYPLIVDWYGDAESDDPRREGDAVVWIHRRKRDVTEAADLAQREHATAEILAGLEIAPDRLHVKHRGRQTDGEGGRAQYERVDHRSVVKLVREHDLSFEINLSDYVDVGLFLDHRPTRRTVRNRAEGRRVLNLFAYTGAFSVHARAGGATLTTTVDMSKTYLDWYVRNLDANGFALDENHTTEQADCLEWLAREAKSPRLRYDIVICDPPTFSNSKRMKAGSFSIDRDHPGLLADIAPLVAPGGEIFFSTNSRGFELSPDAIPADFGHHEISHRSVPEDFRNRRIHRCWRIAQGWKERGVVD